MEEPITEKQLLYLQKILAKEHPRDFVDFRLRQLKKKKIDELTKAEATVIIGDWIKKVEEYFSPEAQTARREFKEECRRERSRRKMSYKEKVWGTDDWRDMDDDFREFSY